MPLNEEGLPGRPAAPLPVAPRPTEPGPGWDTEVQREIDAATRHLDDVDDVVEVAELAPASRIAFAGAQALIAQAYAAVALGRLIEDLSGEVQAVAYSVADVGTAAGRQRPLPKAVFYLLVADLVAAVALLVVAAAVLYRWAGIS